MPGRVHDAKTERSKHNKKGVEGRKVWDAAARYDEALQGSFNDHYSVFPFLRRVVYKLSSEVGCGEVTNPK